MTVEYGGGGSGGLGLMLGGLMEQNLARDPSRQRLLRPAVVSVTAPDAGAAATVRVSPGRVVVSEGADAAAHIRVAADSSALLALAAAPLRFGLPDPFRAAGRAVIRDVLAGRVRVRGLISHPRRLARFTMLLSVD